MGVKNLWTLLSPAARPVQLESLRSRKLAIDASIWIHQFMRTMRSEDGQVLTNGHLLGFFRRICKLLFYNIKPVFVFDGGAPALKLSTIRERRRRREGVQSNIQRTAKKILKAQMKQQLIVEEKRRRNNQMEEIEENNEQLDNLEAIQLLKHQNTIKQDQYDLPPTPHETNRDKETGFKKDIRLATNEELQDFIDEFKPSDIDMDSATFHALPTEIQYEIIQDLKLKSRQTSWARLNNMIQHSKTAMDFSKQQILQLKHRNDMTQRVFQMNDMVGHDNNNNNNTPSTMPSRIASERGKAYLLVKNEKLEEGLGWKLPGATMTSSTGLINQNVDENKDNDNNIETDVFIEKEEEEEKKVGDHENTLNTQSVDGFDPVENAIKNNPALSSLMKDFFNNEQLDDDDDQNNNRLEEEQQFESEMDTFEEYDYDSDDDELPLFMNQQSQYQNHQTPTSYLDKEQSIYEVDDDDIAINQVLFKMYHEEQQQQQELNNIESFTNSDNSDNNGNNNQNKEFQLSSDEFYQLWLTRVPDSFIYIHSINDEYKNILKKAIDDTTKISDLEQQMKSIQKSFGKTNESDTITLTSLGFHQQFLNSVILWKKCYNATAIIESSDNNVNDNNQVNYDGIEFSKDFLVDQQHNTHVDILKDDEASGTDEETDDINSIQLNDSFSTTDDSHSLRNIKTDDLAKKKKTMDDMEYTKKTMTDDEVRMDQEEEVVVEEMDKEKELENEQNIEYISDDELIQHAEDEDDEYARFISDIASRDLDTVKQELANDLRELNQKQYKQLGNADTITDQMVQEIQELLQLFGIPYLVSPMEAEAQCSFLLENKLVDGVVTDDSDVFLFGGNRIYKNMFHQQKYVECYLLNDIDREMQLDRKKLIQLAFLLGSDYTSGIPGIGPVTAMEILSAFQNTNDNDGSGDDVEDSVEEPLIRFKNWYEGDKDDTDFQKKLRNKLKHLDIPDDFPNPLIKEAYYDPVVDKSLENFVWLPPQLDSLRVYLMKSFSWSEEKTDEVLIPVIREMNQNKMNAQQPTINSYFDVSTGISSQKRKHKSKRVQNVVNQLKQQKKRKV